MAKTPDTPIVDKAIVASAVDAAPAAKVEVPPPFTIDEFVPATTKEVLEIAQQMKQNGTRLAAVTGLEGERPGEIELVYSYVPYNCDVNGCLAAGHELNYSLIVKDSDTVQSISHLHQQAFIFENEIADLYGLKFKDLLIDYKNKFYTTKSKAPMLTPVASFSEIDADSEASEVAS